MTRPYHHGNLRAALVATAADLARERGPEGVVLREVARRTGVSHNAAYRHFAHRDQLLVEVAAEGMGRLAAHMRQGLDAVAEDDPVLAASLRLRAVGRAYVEFALTEPGFFGVAFAAVAHEAPPAAPGSERADEVDPYTLLNRALDDLVEVGALPAERRRDAEVACWSSVHGFAVLHLAGPMRTVPAEERDRALEAMLTLLEGGLLGTPG